MRGDQPRPAAQTAGLALRLTTTVHDARHCADGADGGRPEPGSR
ncbi:hypothetical protein [Streptomyces smyrnaeus]